MRLIDLTGRKFGRLTVIRRAPNRKKRTMWECCCDCADNGETVVVGAHALTTGGTKSCGCLQSERAAENIKLAIEARRSHGMTNTPEYAAWQNMLDRGTNPKSKYYPSYGGRGITVHEEWVDSFEAFYAYIGPMPPDKRTVGRLNNDLPYQPGNVEWQSYKEQSRNKRTTHWLTLNGVTKSLTDWAEELGVSRPALYYRSNVLEWSDEKTLTTPLRKQRLKGQKVAPEDK